MLLWLLFTRFRSQHEHHSVSCMVLHTHLTLHAGLITQHLPYHLILAIVSGVTLCVVTSSNHNYFPQKSNMAFCWVSPAGLAWHVSDTPQHILHHKHHHQQHHWQGQHSRQGRQAPYQAGSQSCSLSTIQQQQQPLHHLHTTVYTAAGRAVGPSLNVPSPATAAAAAQAQQEYNQQQHQQQQQHLAVV